MGMDTSGNIYPLSEGESPKTGDALLTQAQKDFLEKFEAKERWELHKNLLSKNHSAKKRARKTIAKASRRRNRQ